MKRIRMLKVCVVRLMHDRMTSDDIRLIIELRNS